MKLIEPKAVWLGEATNSIELIEKAGRICYRSEPKGDARAFVERLIARGHLSVLEHSNASLKSSDSVEQEIWKCWPTSRFMEHKPFYTKTGLPDHSIKTGNFRCWLELWYTLDEILSFDYPIPHEHKRYSAHIICDRGVLAEITRHRTLSFCLSGDTVIQRWKQTKGRKNLTIKQLWERQQQPQLRGRNSLIKLRSMTPDGKLVPNSFVKVIHSGEKDVLEVKTKLGYYIKTTKDHIFFTPDGERKLEQLNVGSKLWVNGKRITISNDEIKREYEENYLAPMEISKKFGICYQTVIKILKYLGIFERRKNDKDLWKYNKNHNEESFKKSGETNKKLYDLGLKRAWNKGLHPEDDERVARMSKNLTHKFTKENAPKREAHPSWVGDSATVSGKRLRFVKLEKVKCELCGCEDKHKLENHHIDSNPSNDALENKMTLCVPCHKLIHKGPTVLHVVADEIVSITHIGKEETFDLEMAAPYHNFVANGFVVHNSVESSRYCDYSGEMEFVRPCWDYKNFLGQIENVVDEAFFEEGLKDIESYYKYFRRSGWKPEQARYFMPMGAKTEMIVTGGISSYENFFKLRLSKAAHPSIREIAEMLHKELPWR
jgi:thymidylate synthase ThyX